MFDNIAINTCLGIVFVVLLYSLLATIIQEIVARGMGLRGRMLQKSIRRMLEDDTSKSRLTLLNFFRDTGYDLYHFFRPFAGQSFSKAFFDHPSIKYLAENTWTSKPSYLSADNFSQAMLALLRNNSLSNHLNPAGTIKTNLDNNTFDQFTVNPQTLQQLRSLMAESHGDIDAFRLKLEQWFNTVMDRSTGWYKRQTQGILFVIGIVVAGIFNADLIAISKIIANNPDARNALVTMASNSPKGYQVIIDSMRTRGANDTGSKVTVVTYAVTDSNLLKTYDKVNQDIESINSILGLGRDKKCTTDTSCISKVNKMKDSLCTARQLTRESVAMLQSAYDNCTTCKETTSPYQEGRSKIWGWLLMAVAISLGAPFWFDLLNKIMMLRGSGKKQTDTPPVTPVPPATPAAPIKPVA